MINKKWNVGEKQVHETLKETVVSCQWISGKETKNEWLTDWLTDWHCVVQDRHWKAVIPLRGPQNRFLKESESPHKSKIGPQPVPAPSILQFRTVFI